MKNHQHAMRGEFHAIINMMTITFTPFPPIFTPIMPLVRRRRFRCTVQAVNCYLQRGRRRCDRAFSLSSFLHALMIIRRHYYGLLLGRALADGARGRRRHAVPLHASMIRRTRTMPRRRRRFRPWAIAISRLSQSMPGGRHLRPRTPLSFARIIGFACFSDLHSQRYDASLPRMRRARLAFQPPCVLHITSIQRFRRLSGRFNYYTPTRLPRRAALCVPFVAPARAHQLEIFKSRCRLI